MQALRIETTISDNGLLTLTGLPLHAGEQVEVIILVRAPAQASDSHPLRGSIIEYIDPFEPVSDTDWEAAS